MSDSENDLLPSNVYTYQNESTTVCAKGPNVNNTNISSLSFRNNVLTSTMQMPRNFMRQQYTEPSFDQRSMYYRSRRDTSPMSMYSSSDMRARNYHQSFYPGVMSSQRSMYNGRSGSPMSVRSIDSNASVSAADIAMAFKNVKFNKHDLRMIKDAYNKFMKQRVRKKIEKRRNLRLFLKGYRRKSGYDSGEQGSDSSISSDGCRSTNSAMYRNNMSSCRSTRTDITDFRHTIKESNMYKDCTDNLKQNAFKNMFSVAPGGAGERFNGHNTIQNSMQNHQTLTQKDRFKSGFLLPSQRFNKSIASVAIPEKDKMPVQTSWNPKKAQEKDVNHKKAPSNIETDSDQEEIFTEVTVREKSTHNLETHFNKVTDQGKRSLSLEDNHEFPNSKRTKLSSPVKHSRVNSKPDPPSCKANTKSNNILKENNVNNPITCEKTDDFPFVKPQFPVRKSGPGKFKEKLISKSAVPLTDAIIPPENLVTKEIAQKQSPQKGPQPNVSANNIEKALEAQSESIQTSASDVSLRPSFIKRKLFTQKMDLAEKKNLSCEALNVNSPQTNVYSAIQREKNKARKVVTNQSCLNRDVLQEDNNLLDLIHKIVPPDRMNMTNVTNKTSLSCKNNTDDNKNIDDDKWDVTSIISTCNNDDVSDTYTDEEIFDNTKKKVKRVSNNNKKDKKTDIEKPFNDCRIVVEKFPIPKEVTKTIAEANKITTHNKVNEPIKKSVYNCVKSFWDTDIESDMESPGPKRLKTNVNEHLNKSISHNDKNIRNNKTLDVHNVTSVSEISKSKITLPINGTRQLKKYNINRNLTIKAFMTPKLQISAKEDKPVANNSTKPKPLAFTESPSPTPKHVKNNKNNSKVTTTNKTTTNKNNSNKKESNNKQAKDKSDPKTSKKTEPKISKQSQNIKQTNDKKKETDNKKKETDDKKKETDDKRKETVAAKQKPQTKKVNSKTKEVQNKTNTKSSKPKNVEAALNTSIATRLSRTPKIKMTYVTPKRGQDQKIPSDRITRSSEKLTRSAERITRSSQKKQPPKIFLTMSKEANNIPKKTTSKHNTSRTVRNTKK